MGGIKKFFMKLNILYHVEIEFQKLKIIHKIKNRVVKILVYYTVYFVG
jgi:hypothetical protein